MELIATRLQSTDNVLGRGLQQSHNIGDEFVLAIDGHEGVEILLAYIDGLLDISSLECGDSLLLTAEFLDEFSRRVTRVAEQQGGGASQGVIEATIVDVTSIHGLLQQGVLDNHHLDASLESSAAQVHGLLGIERCGVSQVNDTILVKSLLDLVDH